jgi:hypothetical protein
LHFLKRYICEGNSHRLPKNSRCDEGVSVLTLDCGSFLQFRSQKKVASFSQVPPAAPKSLEESNTLVFGEIDFGSAHLMPGGMGVLLYYIVSTN